MLRMLQDLGVVPSFSRPAVSDDNPYSEALFKTLKYHPTFPSLQRFKGISEARTWCEQFVTWYNTQHLHSGLKFVTPEQRHQGQATGILAQRRAVYEQARVQHPERWSGSTRNWTLPDGVYLNPQKQKEVKPLDSLRDDRILEGLSSRVHETIQTIESRIF